ncbi:MAG: DUF4412 domain-containing protein [Bacteroidota bacterium]
MKKIINYSAVILLICIYSASFAQNTFEGSITFKISTEGRDLTSQEKAQMPSEQILQFKGPKSRIDINTPMGSVVTISDADTKENIVLFDMMGQQLAVKSTKEENEKALADMPKPEVNDLGESKEIAGYSCKKYEIKSENSVMTAYITDAIDATDPQLSNVEGLKGVILEYSVLASEDDELILIYTATEVKKAKLKKTLFVVPSGYQELTPEEFRNMLGG